MSRIRHLSQYFIKTCLSENVKKMIPLYNDKTMPLVAEDRKAHGLIHNYHWKMKHRFHRPMRNQNPILYNGILPPILKHLKTTPNNWTEPCFSKNIHLFYPLCARSVFFSSLGLIFHFISINWWYPLYL